MAAHIAVATVFARSNSPRPFPGQCASLASGCRTVDFRYEPHGSTPVIMYTAFVHMFEQWKRFRTQIDELIDVGAFGGPDALKIVQHAGVTDPLCKGG